MDQNVFRYCQMSPNSCRLWITEIEIKCSKKVCMFFSYLSNPVLFKVLQRNKTNSMCVCLLTKSCLTLGNPMDYSLPSSSVHGISQARTLEWVVISFSRGSSRLKDWTQVSCMAGRFFTTEPPGKPCKVFITHIYIDICLEYVLFYFWYPVMVTDDQVFRFFVTY